MSYGKAGLVVRARRALAVRWSPFRNLGRSSIAALVLSLFVSLASAQASAVDTAIGNFQTEGVRLVGIIGTAGFTIVGAWILISLGLSMLKKTQAAK